MAKNVFTQYMDGPSAYENDALPVVGFCFQEPENDPRNFVYVWILRSENDIDSQEEKEHSLSNIALISLYAMAFQNKVSTYIHSQCFLQLNLLKNHRSKNWIS